MSSKKRADIAHNARIKEYPDYYELCISSKPDYFIPQGWEKSGWKNMEGLTKVKTVEKPERSEAETRASRQKAQARARMNIRDIAASSAFEWFITLTIDAEKLERYNYDVIIERVNRWLSNAVQRKGFAYVLVPERHKDGAIHFHGLCRGNMSYVDSGHLTKKGQKIFNLLDWKFGFTGCIRLEGEYMRVVNYITKYITKDSEKIGGRWYLSGGKIQKPAVSFADISYRDIDAKGHFIPKAFVSFKYLRIDKNEITRSENLGTGLQF